MHRCCCPVCVQLSGLVGLAAFLIGGGALRAFELLAIWLELLVDISDLSGDVLHLRSLRLYGVSVHRLLVEYLKELPSGLVELALQFAELGPQLPGGFVGLNVSAAHATHLAGLSFLTKANALLAATTQLAMLSVPTTLAGTQSAFIVACRLRLCRQHEYRRYGNYAYHYQHLSHPVPPPVCVIYIS